MGMSNQNFLVQVSLTVVEKPYKNMAVLSFVVNNFLSIISSGKQKDDFQLIN